MEQSRHMDLCRYRTFNDFFFFVFPRLIWNLDSILSNKTDLFGLVWARHWDGQTDGRPTFKMCKLFSYHVWNCGVQLLKVWICVKNIPKSQSFPTTESLWNLVHIAKLTQLACHLECLSSGWAELTFLKCPLLSPPVPHVKCWGFTVDQINWVNHPSVIPSCVCFGANRVDRGRSGSVAATRVGGLITPGRGGRVTRCERVW